MDERAVPISSTFLRHRAAAAPPPPKLTLSDDIEPIPSPNSYTSLKDLIPSFDANSPRDESSPQPVSIRNRLVMRAASAYLRPMSSSPESDGGGFLLGRVWRRAVALLDGMRRGLAWVVEWALRLVRMRSST